MKTFLKIIFVHLFLVPSALFAQEDLVNSIDIEGINLLGYPKLDIGLIGGFGYRLETIPDGTFSESREHLENMKSGPVYGISAFYFTKETFGLGLTYSRFDKAGSMKETQTLHVKEERLVTDFIGPTIYFRQSDNSENIYYGPLIGLGYLRFKQSVYARDNNYNRYDPESDNFEELYRTDYTGGAFAFQVGMKVQYKITKQLALGAQAGLYMGINSTRGFWQIRKENNAQRESLSRVELGISLHYLKY